MECSILVISRTIGDTFRIGDDVMIEVVDCSGNTAKLGITAPKNIAIHREEIYDKIRDAASQHSSPSVI